MFDDSLEDLGLTSYGISVTTLEEVFLKVGSRDGEKDDDEDDPTAIQLEKKAEEERPQDGIDKFSTGDSLPDYDTEMILN